MAPGDEICSIRGLGLNPVRIPNCRGNARTLLCQRAQLLALTQITQGYSTAVGLRNRRSGRPFTSNIDLRTQGPSTEKREMPVNPVGRTLSPSQISDETVSILATAKEIERLGFRSRGR